MNSLVYLIEDGRKQIERAYRLLGFLLIFALIGYMMPETIVYTLPYAGFVLIWLLVSVNRAEIALVGIRLWPITNFALQDQPEVSRLRKQNWSLVFRYVLSLTLMMMALAILLAQRGDDPRWIFLLYTIAFFTSCFLWKSTGEETSRYYYGFKEA